MLLFNCQKIKSHFRKYFQFSTIFLLKKFQIKSANSCSKCNQNKDFRFQNQLKRMTFIKNAAGSVACLDLVVKWVVAFGSKFKKSKYFSFSLKKEHIINIMKINHWNVLSKCNLIKKTKRFVDRSFVWSVLKNYLYNIVATN